MEAYPEKTDALILSGGGAWAAYEVGVLRALFAGESMSTGYKPIEPEIVGGTSAGAYNAALLAARAAQDASAAIGEIERVWLEGVSDDRSAFGNGSYRVRAAPPHPLRLRRPS